MGPIINIIKLFSLHTELRKIEPNPENKETEISIVEFTPKLIDRKKVVYPSSEPAERNPYEFKCCEIVNSLLFDKFTECGICLEPLQITKPCACPRCGGVWCDRCDWELLHCMWCRWHLDVADGPCIELDSLLKSLYLPCRNVENGCTALLRYSERDQHEIYECEKKPPPPPPTLSDVIKNRARRILNILNTLARKLAPYIICCLCGYCTKLYFKKK